MAFRIAFFDTKPYDEESFNKMNERFGFDIVYFKGHLNPNNVMLTKGYDAVCIFVNDTADAEVVNALIENGVKILALRCAGYNNVDLSAAEGRLPIVRVPAYSPYAVAEYTLALILALNRRIPRAVSRTRDGNFSLHGLMGFDMHEKVIGIIGTGKIAKVLIRILYGLGMRILAYDPYPDKELVAKYAVEYTTLDELYRLSDIVSLHCPLTDETRYIINEDAIAKMKQGVMLINTGRGKLIHTHSLIKGLKSKKIGYAALDVYEEESRYFYEDKSDRIIDDDVLARLLSFNNVIVTSHQAFFTREAVHNISETTLQNIADFAAGRSLKNEVVR
ncbi:MAG: 2-hydroxyacid dehydrogenase [Porphyromonadaceae bacterium]|nr:2-hydroxyacid dehydrogenase [Porphyromonadaceae bacterium]